MSTPSRAFKRPRTATQDTYDDSSHTNHTSESAKRHTTGFQGLNDFPLWGKILQMTHIKTLGSVCMVSKSLREAAMSYDVVFPLVKKLVLNWEPQLLIVQVIGAYADDSPPLSDDFIDWDEKTKHSSDVSKLLASVLAADSTLAVNCGKAVRELCLSGSVVLPLFESLLRRLVRLNDFTAVKRLTGDHPTQETTKLNSKRGRGRPKRNRGRPKKNKVRGVTLAELGVGIEENESDLSEESKALLGLTQVVSRTENPKLSIEEMVRRLLLKLVTGMIGHEEDMIKMLIKAAPWCLNEKFCRLLTSNVISVGHCKILATLLASPSVVFPKDAIECVCEHKDMDIAVKMLKILLNVSAVNATVDGNVEDVAVTRGRGKGKGKGKGKEVAAGEGEGAAAAATKYPKVYFPPYTSESPQIGTIDTDLHGNDTEKEKERQKRKKKLPYPEKYVNLALQSACARGSEKMVRLLIPFVEVTEVHIHSARVNSQKHIVNLLKTIGNGNDVEWHDDSYSEVSSSVSTGGFNVNMNMKHPHQQPQHQQTAGSASVAHVYGFGSGSGYAGEGASASAEGKQMMIKPAPHSHHALNLKPQLSLTSTSHSVSHSEAQSLSETMSGVSAEVEIEAPDHEPNPGPEYSMGVGVGLTGKVVPGAGGFGYGYGYTYLHDQEGTATASYGSGSGSGSAAMISNDSSPSVVRSMDTNGIGGTSTAVGVGVGKLQERTLARFSSPYINSVIGGEGGGDGHHVESVDAYLTLNLESKDR